jgi:Protein of unknown function (DUF3106)
MKVRENNTASRLGRRTSAGLSLLSRLSSPVLFLALAGLPLFTRGAEAIPLASQQTVHPTPAPSPHVQAPAPPNSPPHTQNNSMPEARSGTVQPKPPAAHPEQQHLPDWWNSHRNLTPSQQDEALRREPGFHNLPQDQQERLLNRLHSLDQKTPEQRQRILARNEAFEHLSPERRQEVRGAAQALNQMSPDRQQVVRRAFQQLRRMPTQQRQQLLYSRVYGGQFSPQEKTVLGNLLSIEPYTSPRTIPQPYFGRP